MTWKPNSCGVQHIGFDEIECIRITIEMQFPKPQEQFTPPQQPKNLTKSAVGGCSFASSIKVGVVLTDF